MKCTGLIMFCGCILVLVASMSLVKGQNTTEHIRLLTILEPPFVMKNPQTGKYYGFLIDVLHAVSGIRIDHIQSIEEGTAYGMEERPGEFTGITGELANGRADLAVAAFTIDSKKSKVVTYTQAVIHAGFMVLYKTPTEWSPRTKAMATLVKAFSPGLWSLIFFMCLLAGVALHVILRFSPYEQVSTSPWFYWSSDLLYIYSSMLGRSK